MTVTEMKEWVAREYTQATAEVHAFIAWVEQKDAHIQSAKTLLEANGYVVTPKS